MMGLISRVATSSQVGTKLKSLANLARLLTEADLVTCGQVGHKYKMVFKLITIFMEAERIILFNLTELTCDQVDHKLKWSNFRTSCPEVNCGQVGHHFCGSGTSAHDGRKLKCGPSWSTFFISGASDQVGPKLDIRAMMARIIWPESKGKNVRQVGAHS